MLKMHIVKTIADYLGCFALIIMQKNYIEV